jgi:DNA-binding CsgD family transcriptional regulator/tetratricopeptide (TPR) repeat protein
VALHGRESEVDRVQSLIDQALAGEGAVLVVRGEPGTGKSALLEEAQTLATGMRVLRAVGLETEQEMAFGVIHQLLHRDLEALAGLPAPQQAALRAAFGLEPAESAPDRFMISVAVYGLLGELAAGGPLLCIVDDLQWADVASLDALSFAARRIGEDGIALLIGTRPGRATDSVAGGGDMLEVGDLDAASAVTLLSEAGGAGVSGAVGKRLAEETGGNPLALIEVARELSPAQLAGTAELPAPLPVGSGVERAYSVRVHQLPAAAKTALLVAAVQSEGTLDVALAAARELGSSETDFDLLEQQGFLTIDAGRFRFRHPLLRSTAYAASPGASRRAAHRAVASHLGDDPERRAWQLAAAAVGPDPRVADDLIEVAASARARGAPAAAAAALRRAADLTTGPAERVILLADAAEEAWTAGQGELALDLIARARQEGADDEVDRGLTRLQGRIDAWGGKPTEGCRILCREAAVVTGSPRLALELLAEAAEAASFTADRRLTEEVESVAATVASDRDGPSEQLLRALVAGTNHLASGRVEEAAPLLRDSVRLGRELDDPVSLNLAGRAAIYLGDETASIEVDRRAADQARAAGTVFTLPSILVRTAINEVRLGRLLAAEATATEAIDLAGDTGQRDLVACGLAALSSALALRGLEADAREAAERAIAMAQERELMLFGDLARAAVAGLELAGGRADEAMSMLERTTHPAVVMLSIADRVEATMKAGRPEAAAAAAETARRWSDASRVGAAEAAALHCEAAVAQPDDGVELYEAALVRHRTLNRPFERARSELALGELLRRRRRRTESRPHLKAAMEGFESIRADAWADRAGSELRATGQTTRRRDPSTLDELTPQEIQVGRLVAAGMTNREVAAQLFLSPRTIDFHLRNLFRKLGLTSRTQLAQLDLGGG